MTPSNECGAVMMPNADSVVLLVVRLYTTILYSRLASCLKDVSSFQSYCCRLPHEYQNLYTTLPVHGTSSMHSQMYSSSGPLARVSPRTRSQGSQIYWKGTANDSLYN
jgi:hypothetical protein